ncbi:hypothetical protein CASFOL_030433 [Castilleja foliolosa]|uniref:Uncharacterized protein n=1 Tax=Castilleja foliolosa TaxID=1961234 RepID=A0ABD3C8K0_9LAMI
MGDTGRGQASRPVSEVTRTEKPSLKLRVVRRFYRQGLVSNNRSLEIVFHDLEGGRITGIVKSMHLKSFDDRFIQGRVYAIRTNTYHVENNSGKFLTTLHKFKIIIHAKSFVIDMPEESFFPDFMFNFRDFNDLVDPNKVDETHLFDVIGKVVEIHGAQEKEFNGRSARLIEIVLEDLSTQRLSCTLWGDYVNEILAFESSIRSAAPVIILQLCRAKVFRDKVILSNSFDTTQLHTLETLPAIVQFKSQIREEELDRTISISRGSVTSFRLEYDDLANGKITCNSVETIVAIDQPVSFWICAMIGSVIGDWSYLACPKCNKKLEPCGMENICDSCYKSFKTGTHRYKLQLEVLDQTANVYILLWDREAEKLIGRPCQELQEEYVENLKSEKTGLPYDLYKLVDQTVLFKIKVERKNFHKDNVVFPVTRLVTDSNIVAKYNQLTVEPESGADFLTLMLNEEINCGTNSEDEVNTPVKKVFDKKVKEEGSTSVKSLNFDEECAGSSTAKMDRHPSMTKKQYMRKFVVQEDDDKQQIEDNESCEDEDNEDKRG